LIFEQKVQEIVTLTITMTHMTLLPNFVSLSAFIISFSKERDQLGGNAWLLKKIALS